MSTTARTARPRASKKLTNRDRLQALGRWVGGSIGQAEALAGIDPQNSAERQQLWSKFKHLYGEPAPVLVGAVSEHCATLTLQRLAEGKLSLLHGTYFWR